MFSSEVPKDVVAVIPVTPVNRLVRNVNQPASGALTVFTTDSFRDTYVTDIFVGLIKDAACDTADGQFVITAVIDGNTVSLVQLPLLTLTAQNQNVHISLKYPIKLDRNTSVFIANSAFAAGKMRRTATVYGYTEEVQAS